MPEFEIYVRLSNFFEYKRESLESLECLYIGIQGLGAHSEDSGDGDSSGKPNSIPVKANSRRSPGEMIVQEVFGFVKLIGSAR